MISLPLTGGCLCNQIRFQVDADPIWVGYCHCQSCRRSTGAPFVMHVGVHPNALTFTDGQPKIYDSSPGVARGFCATCGTSISYEADRFPNYIQLYAGTFDTPAAFTPQAHVHTAEQLPFLKFADGLPSYPHSAAKETEWR